MQCLCKKLINQNNIYIQGKQILQRTRSFNTLKREFELADVLDYVKTGVEAIIEDQVTSRFEAEELKVNIYNENVIIT